MANTQSMTAIEEVVGGRYKIEKKLGEGGMSQVYLAQDTNVFGSRVAIKVMSLEDSGLSDRFVEEAKGQSHLGQHPNICGVKDTVKGPNGKLKYIVMDFIPGESFQNFILRNQNDLHNPITRNIMLQIVIESCRALQYAHTAKLPGREDVGIIHRDVKPENMMLQDLGDGRLSPILVDFGLCRIGTGVGYTSDSRVFGTPIYASPEQLLHPTSVTYRTDIFSMGLIIYWIFAGERFYDAAEELSAFSIIPYFQANRDERLKLIQDPAAYAIVSKAIAIEPKERYHSATELANDLQAYLDFNPAQPSHQHIVSQSPTLHYSNRQQSSPKRTASTVAVKPMPADEPEPETSAKSSKTGLIAGIIVALVVLIGAALYFSTRGESEATKKEKPGTSTQSSAKTEPSTSGEKPMMQKAAMPSEPPSATRRTSPKSETAEEKANKLFEQWYKECQETDTRRDYFKTTPSLHSVCIRQKRAIPYIKKTKSFAIGRLTIKLLRAKFCTGYNLKYDRSMKKECRRIAHVVLDIDTWEKLHDCQVSLTALMQKGDAEEKGLPAKCKKMRWYLDPKPTFVPECQKAYKRDGEKQLSDNCKSIFKAFPALKPL